MYLFSLSLLQYILALLNSIAYLAVEKYLPDIGHIENSEDRDQTAPNGAV